MDNEIKELLCIIAEYIVLDANRRGILQSQTAHDLARVRRIRKGKIEMPKVIKPEVEKQTVTSPSLAVKTKRKGV